MRNAMIIDPKDNVAVAIEPIAKGETATYICEGKELATRDIRKGEPVVKYGEHIGIASCDIKAGEHVHVHNVEGHRENLEAKE